MPDTKAKGYTKGPWEAQQYLDGERQICSGSRKIAVMTWTLRDMQHEGDSPEDEANARLIAACPELLEALERMVGFLTTLQTTLQNLYPNNRQEFIANSTAMQMSRAAIRKATGEGE